MGFGALFFFEVRPTELVADFPAAFIVFAGEMPSFEKTFRTTEISESVIRRALRISDAEAGGAVCLRTVETRVMTVIIAGADEPAQPVSNRFIFVQGRGRPGRARERTTAAAPSERRRRDPKFLTGHPARSLGRELHREIALLVELVRERDGQGSRDRLAVESRGLVSPLQEPQH